jgi:release factor glutamine methyltransferase
MSCSLASCVQSICTKIASAYPTHEQQQQVAWWLIEFVTNKNRAALLTNSQRMLTDQEEEKINQLIAQHIEQHKPLQYIFGSVIFADLTLIMQPPIHIPRPETEEWIMNYINEVQKLTQQSITILDMCTGSGCIALACAYHLPQAHVVGVDSNEVALTCARNNAQHNDITNVSWYKTDLFAGLPESFKCDAIVSNPPYVSRVEWQNLEEDVRLWEDPEALIAQDEGYALIYKLIDQAPQWLVHNQEMKDYNIAQLVIEMSDHQTDTVAAYFKKAGWYAVEIHTDYAGLKRTVSARIT